MPTSTPTTAAASTQPDRASTTQPGEQATEDRPRRGAPAGDRRGRGACHPDQTSAMPATKPAAHRATSSWSVVTTAPVRRSARTARRRCRPVAAGGRDAAPAVPAAPGARARRDAHTSVERTPPSAPRPPTSTIDVTRRCGGSPWRLRTRSMCTTKSIVSRDQRPHRVLGQLGVALGHVERQPGEHRLHRVRVDRGHRAVLAHAGDVEHLQRLVLHQLADHDTVRVQPAGELDQLARRHGAVAVGVRLPGEQRGRVRMARVVLQAQLEQPLLDRHDPLVGWHRAEQLLEQRGLAGTRTTGHEHRHARLHERLELGHEPLGEQAARRQAVEPDALEREPADGDARLGATPRCGPGRRAP